MFHGGCRDGVSPPVRGAYLANGTLPSGEGGNDTQGTGHELSVGTADPSGEGGNATSPMLVILSERQRAEGSSHFPLTNQTFDAKIPRLRSG